MKTTDLIHFLAKRVRQDSPKAFIFRLIRMAVIFPYKLKMWLWWKRLQRQFLIYGNTYLAVNIKGNFMRLNMLETGIARDLLYNRAREPFANFAFMSALKPDDVVVDIGANIGYYALQEARVAKKVYAIEPNPESIKQLNANIRQLPITFFPYNLLPKIQVFQMAIGDYNGTATLNITDESNLCNLSGEVRRQHTDTCQVPIFTLDTFMEDKPFPSVIRMDVEGYEYEIIKGMAGLLAQDSPLLLFIELHLDILGVKVKELAQALKDAGFRVISASVEPHPAVMRYKLGIALTAFCDRQIGSPQGYGELTIDDLINNDLYTSGQVEWLEVFFGR